MSVGIFTSKARSQAHIDAGAKRVLISAPAGNDVDATVVYGESPYINIRARHCFKRVMYNQLFAQWYYHSPEIGLVNGLMTTIHAYASDQISRMWHIKTCVVHGQLVCQ